MSKAPWINTLRRCQEGDGKECGWCRSCRMRINTAKYRKRKEEENGKSKGRRKA